MKYQDEYRDPVAANQLRQAICDVITRPWTIMEVCGGQTHTIVRYGLTELLPPELEVVHGPGCPVCVTAVEMVDQAIELAARPNVIFCSFGDMLRVPGTRCDLLHVKASGGDVRIVLSPLDCLRLAQQNPDKTVIFFAVGFETTAPANAMAIWQAKRCGMTNFAVLVSHVLVPPAIAGILSSPANRVQGFLGAGHVTGDTKVVDRGKGDQVFITTSGIGVMPRGRSLAIRNIRPGDRIILSGTMGDHGIAVMSVREGLEFETVLESDTAPLNSLTEAMLQACPNIRWMRDPTRGGVSSTLNEAAVAARVGIRITEAAIPIRPEVHAACEMLGLDPLYVANEGKLIAVVPPEEADRVVDIMRSHPLGRDAAIIGEVVEDHPGLVVAQTLVGGERIVAMLSGEQLPRIC